MEGLVAIVNGLTKGEINLVKHLYRIKNSPDRKKRDQLFNLIIKGELKTDEEGRKRLNPNNSHSAWCQLKSRLKSDILNTIILQDSAVKYKTPYAQAAFECRRAYIQGELLLGRGIYNEAIKLLNNAAKQARKFELVPELIMIEDLLRNHTIMKEGVDSFQEKSRSINNSIELLQKMQSAKYHHYEITVPAVFQANSRNKSEEYFRKKGNSILNKIEKDFEETGSARIGFYYYMTAMNFHAHLKKYNEALNFGLKLLELVDENPVVSSKSNIAGVNMEISNILINLNEYDRAVTHGTDSLAMFKRGLINELYALENLFFAYFRKGDFEAAAKILSRALKHEMIKYSVPLSSRWAFLKAGFEFQLGNFRQSMQLIKSDKGFTKEKSAFLPGYYFLEILNKLELGDEGWLTFKYEYLKKQLLKLNDRDECDNGQRRCVLILGILRTLIRNHFNYKDTVEQEKSKIRLLQFGQKDYRWNPTGYEIIRFEEWILSKATSRKSVLA